MQRPNSRCQFCFDFGRREVAVIGVKRQRKQTSNLKTCGSFRSHFNIKLHTDQHKSLWIIYNILDAERKNLLSESKFPFSSTINVHFKRSDDTLQFW
ncbi:hypothetical protein Plhal304r1_c089g0170951 [Plasmopara halstedii]